MKSSPKWNVRPKRWRWRWAWRGLMNVQFAVQDGPDGQQVYLIEVNPRASRTVPFVAKAIGQPIAKYAARVMAGGKAGRSAADPPAERLCGGEGSGVPLCALPGHRSGADAPK